MNKWMLNAKDKRGYNERIEERSSAFTCVTLTAWTSSLKAENSQRNYCEIHKSGDLAFGWNKTVNDYLMWPRFSSFSLS